MYNAFVVPYFYYCSTVWYDGSISNLTKMLKLQKKAARVITGDSYDIRSDEVFRKLNWLPMNIHLQIREHIATFKALTGNSPAYLTKLFIRCSNETYSLRSNYNELSLAKPRTDFLKKSFSYRAAKSWNNLPLTITQNIGNKTVNVLQTLLINHYRNTYSD